MVSGLICIAVRIYYSFLPSAEVSGDGSPICVRAF